MSKDIHVLFAIFEASPFIATGGLGEVGGALPPALQKAGCHVQVILPKFQFIAQEFRDQMEHVADFYVPLAWRSQYCGIEKLDYNNVTYFFIDNEYYFYRDGIYGFGDDAERIAFFDKAVLESLQHIPNIQYDILHCHDWHTSLIPVFLREFYHGLPLYDKIHTVFTIHNLKFQGIFPSEVLGDVLGLADIKAAADQLAFLGAINYMKGALCYSDILTTVSPTYAMEIRNSYFGEKMEDILSRKQDRLFGILNGIDTEEYNPAHDRALAATYSVQCPVDKAKNKAALQEKLGLEKSADTPFLVMVSRFTEQKGLDLLLRILDDLLSESVQVAILGTGDRYYENALQEIAWRHPSQMKVHILFDNTLSRLFYAGGDLLMMPSRFEPCGLSQMIAMRYGTLPVVRETGGLKDSITPYNRYTGKGNGFSFANFNAHELLFVLKEAIRVYREEPETWHSLIAQAMSADFSWSGSAAKYMELYQNLV